MDWLVFGDDWGAHPSTTQHLITHLPATDRVVWVDSIGQRRPRLNLTDIKRAAAKARGMFRRDRRSPSDPPASAPPCQFSRIQPRVLPLHLNTAAVSLNGWSLARAINNSCNQLGCGPLTLLSATPVVSFYLGALPQDCVAYLRLDDYAKLPGCDSALIQRSERQMIAEADVVFGTAKRLLPRGAQRSCYLPQGVNFEHFAKTTLQIPQQKTLGFFGLLAEWVDFDLIAAVAWALPDWTLEFVGNARYLPETAKKIPNVRLLPAVPFAELPEVLGRWRAAWIPFVINELTEAVNPLKVREYLAAGLPTLSTPLPEVAALPSAQIVRSANEVARCLAAIVANDSAEQRAKRRESVRGDSWAARAQTLRQTIAEIRTSR